MVVSIRLSPFSAANNLADSDPMPLFERAVDILNGFGLAYLHMVEGQTGGSRELDEGLSIEALRARFDGVYMANNGYEFGLALLAGTVSLAISGAGRGSADRWLAKRVA